MICFQNILALLTKQIKDTLKNMPVLILFFVYPCIAIIMTQAMQEQTGAGTLFLSIFATMHCVFTPIVAAASIVAEEKEKNTLRVLIMSNVTLREYFISIGGFILIAALLTGSAFLFLTRHHITDVLSFLTAMSIGCILSIILGICIGLYARNTAAANGLAVPFAMIFAFLPMLSNFNKSIENVSKFTYGQQVSYLLSSEKLSVSGVCIIIVNVILMMILVAVLYKRSLTEE